MAVVELSVQITVPLPSKTHDPPHDNDQDERHGEDDEQLRGAEADVAGHQGPDAAPEAA